MAKVIVIGGGAAGMMAAIRAAENGHDVTLLEHNEKLGKKLYITGKGRCNVTNACETEDLFANISRNRKFLYSAIYSMTNQGVMDFFTKAGLALKTERGMRVFPQSDHSSDVIRALKNELERRNVEVILHAQVKHILKKDGRVSGVSALLPGKGKAVSLQADAVIAACGGVSYPVTGSDGSGLKLCQEAGHSVTALRPCLVPFNTREDYIRDMQGLSLKNVELSIYDGKKCLYKDFGEMLFTHFGISGPLVISASSLIADKYFEKELSFRINLKPALDREQLDRRICRDFEENINRQLRNAISHLLPSKMLPVLIELSGIEPDRKVNTITREERARLVNLLQEFPGTITGLRGFEEAIITRGGIPVKEINPSTMESKILPGLYLCGEMIDCDALTGGFNLQIAWSTGYLAGDSIPL